MTSKPAYSGVCNLCGAVGEFAFGEAPAFLIARAYACPECDAPLRFRNEAAAIVEVFGGGAHLSMRSLIADPNFAGKAVYNVGIGGHTRKWLARLEDYTQSNYVVDAEPGEIRGQHRNEDLLRLSFGANRFDLVTSSHVLEHVPDPAKAFSEVHRVLRPDGVHIFSVPFPWPPRPKSVTRCAIIDGEVVHDLEPVYHESPGGEPSLVFTDFGLDVLDVLSEVGFAAEIRRPSMAIDKAYRNSVIVCRPLARTIPRPDRVLRRLPEDLTRRSINARRYSKRKLRGARRRAGVLKRQLRSA